MGSGFRLWALGPGPVLISTMRGTEHRINSPLIGHRRPERPSSGAGAPYTVGIHPVDDLSASGTTQWPYMPTRSPRRPACPSNGLVGRRVRKAGRMVRKRGYAVSRGSSTPGRAIGDSPQLYTQHLAVPGPRDWKPCNKRARAFEQQHEPMSGKCHSREAQRGFRGSRWPETAVLT